MILHGNKTILSERNTLPSYGEVQTLENIHKHPQSPLVFGDV